MSRPFHPLTSGRRPDARFAVTPLAQAACLTVALVLGAQQAAQAQPSGGGEVPVAVSIAAQPLSQALTELARQTDTTLVAAPALLAGKTAPAISGTLSARQALERLLVGSGLVGALNDGVITVRTAPPAGGGAALPEVTVTAAAERSGVTEGTGSYTTRSSSTATKLDLSLRETPQTVTVVTRQKMDDFGLSTVDEVLESTSAVSISRKGINGMDYFSRGFMLQSQYDGMPNPAGIGESNKGPTPDTAFFDKIEILQGASGLMAGAGDPGGTINLVRKRPTEDFHAQIEAQFGSWDRKRLVGDISGSFVESGKIRGRAVALVDHSNSFRDYAFDDREGFYGIVEADITDTTLVSTSIMYQKSKVNTDYGVPVAVGGEDLGLPRSRFFGFKDASMNRKSVSYSLNIEQKLPLNWLLKAGYTYTEVEVDKLGGSYFSGALNGTTGDGLSFVAQDHQRKLSSNVFEAYASGPFRVLGREHELVIGGATSKMDTKNRLGPATRIPINVYSYKDNTLYRPSSPLPSWPTKDETTQTGIYSAARFSLSDPLKLILGARVSWYEHLSRGTQTQKESGVITPYAGLIFDINKNYTAYASYSDIFKPQSNLTASGSTVDPIVGKNYELGIKGAFLQERLNAYAAIFKLEQTNIAEIDTNFSPTECNGGYCFRAAGLISSKGIDLGINGELRKGWQIGAGYTYVESEYKTGANTGKQYRSNFPKHIVRTYTSYEIPDSNWTVGGDIRYQSNRYWEGAFLGNDYRISTGGHAVVGLMAKYKINNQAEVGFVVNNLLDRNYYESISNANPLQENFYGAPRNISVNLKYRF